MNSILQRHTSLASVRALALAICTSMILAACGGGSDHPASSSSSSSGGNVTYTLGGTITGPLTGSGLVLTDSVSGAKVTVAANATTFTLAPAVNSGASYSVAVTTQPSSPTESCTVTSGATGTATANVTSIAVTCAVSDFTVGGTITGLTGTGLVLKDTVNNHQVTVLANATTFAINPAVASGTAYTVAVLTQPSAPTQNCVVTAPSGHVTTGNVTSVVVTCTTASFTVGGTIAGYTGSGLVLTDSVSGHTASPASAATAFTLSGTSNSGTTYNVTVTTQPTAPAQHCTVTGGVGPVTTANVTSIGVACKNVGRYVFVANPNDSTAGSVAAFIIAPATGVLTPAMNSPYAEVGGDVAPTGLAVDPSGNFLYVANSMSSDVSTYAIGAGGVLTPDVIAPTPTGTGTNAPFSLAIDPTGAAAPYLYVGSNDTTSAIEAFQVTNGVLTPVTGVLATSTYPAGDVPYGIAVDSTHGFVYSANVFAPSITGFSIAQATGQLTALGGNPFGALAAPYAVTAYPTGQFIYVTDTLAFPATAAGTVNEYSYDNTGALTLQQTKNVGIGPESIAIDPAGKFLYVTNSQDGTVSAFTIDPTTGNLTAVTGSPYTSSAGTMDVPTAAAVDPSSQYLYVANGDAGTVSLFTINATTGALTAVATGVNAYPCVIGGEGPQAIVIE